jgi:UDP-3-O-[3-hydroxymyristoyl] N-acetylglucosamine deacetylase
VPKGPATSFDKVLTSEQLLFSHCGRGLASRSPVKVDVYAAPQGTGIRFSLPNAKGMNDLDRIEISASADYVVNTLRNTVLGEGSARLCIVEHFLAAAALWGAEDMLVHVDGPEMPIGDGSARSWMELFEKSPLERKVPEPSILLARPVMVQDGDRKIMAIPAEKLMLTYLIDWDHPLIGRRWKTWCGDRPYQDIAFARTFGSLKEHELLGVKDDVVSLTSEGFSKPLLYEDEPVRHKLLDLLGDLALIGSNPLRLKAHVISIKGGHALDVALVKELRPVLEFN